MTKLLIKLTPLEKYFIGGERIYEMNDKSNKHYYIRSLETPSQTVLFGTMRYIGIETPESRPCLPKKDEQGPMYSSYKLIPGEGDAQDFGALKGISPLYLMDNKGNFWVPTPMDHKIGKKGEENTHYTPFSDYTAKVQTTQGERIFPKDYSAKEGVTHSWMCLSDSSVRDDLFTAIPQVGINLAPRRKTGVSDENSLFKREYIQLDKDFCFAFFADVDDDFKCNQNIAYIGQGKSPFRVDVDDSAVEPEFPVEKLKDNAVYAQSDIYYNGDMNKLYNLCSFVNVDTRTHRVFASSYLDRQGSYSIQLVRAGSMFVTRDPSEFVKMIKNDHAAIAGFNKTIIGGAKK